LTFDEAYYLSDLQKVGHPHYAARAQWVIDNYAGKRVIELGCGFGQVIKSLRDVGIVAWGVDASQYAIDNTDAPGFVFHVTAGDSDLKRQDFCVSWNFLDCLNNEAEAELICDKLNGCTTNFHVLCTDDGSPDAANYIANGYFIKPMSYWLNLVDSDVILINYHTGDVFNGDGPINIPLNWGMISK